MGLGALLMLIQHVILLTSSQPFSVADVELKSNIPKLASCSDHCGDLKVEFPFGTGKGCFAEDKFFINCTPDSSNRPVPLLGSGNVIVTNISIDTAEVHVKHFSARDCYNSSGLIYTNNLATLIAPSYFISSSKNKFTAIGCDTIAILDGIYGEQEFKTGCVTRCNSLPQVKNGSCSGLGCCQLEIPDGIKNINVSVFSFDNHTQVRNFNPCGYAFVSQQTSFNFSTSYLEKYEEMVPLVLDWAIGQGTCDGASNKTSCLCGENSHHFDSVYNASQYVCKCRTGYDGNPYLPLGCQDIDECTDTNHMHNCTENSTCNNINGSFTCDCKVGFHKVQNICIMNEQRRKDKIIPITVGFGVGIVALVVCSSWAFLAYKKWKLIKLKEKFFKQNGGLMLQQQLSSHGDRSTSTDIAKIFTEEELKKATNNFDESAVVGKGGYGTVFKGILSDGRVVAIKKSKVVDQGQIEQFINEVIVLSQINHRNVVKLLGCCLETQVPLLVYEFVTNGTLYDHLHNKSNGSTIISWEIRVRVASEAAEVLSYLHSSASIPIIHRDVKSTNILLDESFTAKVSDFGASRLVPLDQDQLTTMVQGTLGYLDPEYFLTGQLNEKSDVYSFGVVLVELLTGMKAVCFERPEEDRNLAMYFLTAMKNDRLVAVIDDYVVNVAKIEHITEVAELAKRCLRLKGEERPFMKDIANDLQGLRMMMGEHPWINYESNLEESEHFLRGALDIEAYDSCSGSAAYDSMKNHIITPNTRDGR